MAKMGNNIPSAPGRNRPVDDARRREKRGYHQADGTQVLGPRGPSKEHPPQDNKQRADGSREHTDEHGVGNDDRVTNLSRHCSFYDDHAGPWTERPPNPRFRFAPQSPNQ